jgi:hypothetical protein
MYTNRRRMLRQMHPTATKRLESAYQDARRSTAVGVVEQAYVEGALGVLQLLENPDDQLLHTAATSCGELGALDRENYDEFEDVARDKYLNHARALLSAIAAQLRGRMK